MPNFLGGGSVSTPITSLTETGDNLTTAGDLTITGNLTISGDTTTTNVDTITIEDPIVEIATGNVGNTVNFGIQGTYNDGTQRYAAFMHSKDTNDWHLSEGTGSMITSTVLASTGSLRADTITAATGTFSSTATLPTHTGTTRPSSAAAGTVTYNSSTGALQFFTTSWQDADISEEVLVDIPDVAMTGATTGNWVASDSGNYGASYMGYRVFNDITEKNADLYGWHTANALGYDTSWGTATTVIQTTDSDSTVHDGSWVTLRNTATTVAIHTIRIYTREDLPYRWVKTFTLLGSSDGSTWHHIFDSDTQAYTSADNEIKSQVNTVTSPVSYAYNRLIVTAIQVSNDGWEANLEFEYTGVIS